MSVLDTILNITNYVTGEAITLHPDRCLNARHRGARCTLCANICPADGAITVTDGRPALNNEACLRCGACLQRCPTAAYTRPDAFFGKLEKTVAAMPSGRIDLLCPIHPDPDHGPAPQAVQTKRCLAAISAATLLELAAAGAEIWLDDTFCSVCLLGDVHPAIEQTAADANGWVTLLDSAAPVQLRSRQADPPPAAARPVWEADKPPVSRRGLFGGFRRTGQEIEEEQAGRDVIKTGRGVPVTKRLPPIVTPQRRRVLSLLQTHPATQTPPANAAHLPVARIQVDPAKCSACGLCAKFCTTGALKFLRDDEEFALILEPSLCLGMACNVCVPACPEMALTTQPLPAAAGALEKTALAAGDLSTCNRCGQPIAAGPDLPTTCYACRPRDQMQDYFSALFGDKL